MKLPEAMKHLTPGELDAVKQSYRQGFDWRKTLRHACSRLLLQISMRLRMRLSSTSSRDCRGSVRFDGHGQPVPPKGGRWVD